MVICNHVRVEWLHIVSLAHHLNTAGAIKFLMKDALKYVPIAWAAVLEGGFGSMPHPWLPTYCTAGDGSRDVAVLQFENLQSP